MSVGRGSVQGVADILFLKGVDLGIVRSDTLDYLEKKGYARNIKNQLTFTDCGMTFRPYRAGVDFVLSVD